MATMGMKLFTTLRSCGLSHDLLHHVSMHIREPEVTTGVAVGEAFTGFLTSCLVAGATTGDTWSHGGWGVGQLIVRRLRHGGLCFDLFARAKVGRLKTLSVGFESRAQLRVIDFLHGHAVVDRQCRHR